MRLIDADALLSNIRRAVYPSDLTTTIAVGICESHVKDMPTVECRNCAHYRAESEYCEEWLKNTTKPGWVCFEWRERDD